MRLSTFKPLFAAVGLVGLLTASPALSGEPTRGQMLSFSCAGCHGTDGKSPGSIPDISKLPAEYIRSSMEDFKSGKREATVMERQARGYTDEEIQLIAEYFGKRK